MRRRLSGPTGLGGLAAMIQLQVGPWSRPRGLRDVGLHIVLLRELEARDQNQNQNLFIVIRTTKCKCLLLDLICIIFNTNLLNFKCNY